MAILLWRMWVYMRNLDPIMISHGPSILPPIMIVYQPPVDDNALQLPEGLTYVVSSDWEPGILNARVAYGNFFTGDGTPEEVWTGTGGYSGQAPVLLMKPIVFPLCSRDQPG